MAKDWLCDGDKAERSPPRLVSTSCSRTRMEVRAPAPGHGQAPLAGSGAQARKAPPSVATSPADVGLDAIEPH